MYSFTLTDKFLSKEEQYIFEDQLKYYGLDNEVWEVFASLFKSTVKYTQPLLLRVFQDSELYGAIIITKCSKYGKALFSNRFLSGLINFFGIPYFQWIKFGCCMDMMSNPGFVKDPEKADLVFKAAIHYLKNKGIITIITDYSENSVLYDRASILPALPQALIDCSKFSSVQNYMDNYKNLKRKLKVFDIKGGKFIRIDQSFDSEKLPYLEKCFKSTAKQSIFYLPYQDLYLNAALTTSITKIKNAVYFIATLNGELLGYQAALKTGQYLNALHGAFDRSRKTTYHAYDILFVKMVEFAIEEGLKIIDFGAVLNYTKQKMVNKTVDISYYLIGRNSFIQWLFNILLKFTKIQSNKQLQFKEVI